MRNSKEIYCRYDILTKFKKIIDKKGKFAKIVEVTVSPMEFLLQVRRNFGSFFWFEF